MTTRSRVAVAVLQGKLYAIGGYNGLERLSTVEVFEPDSKKWKRVSSISKPRRSAINTCFIKNFQNSLLYFFIHIKCIGLGSFKQPFVRMWRV